MADSLLEHSEAGDSRKLLEALRDKLSYEIDLSGSARDVAALSRQLVDVVTKLESMESDSKQEGTVLDELAKRRAAGGHLR